MFKIRLKSSRWKGSYCEDFFFHVNTPTQWPRFLSLTPGCSQQPFLHFIFLKKSVIVLMGRTEASLPRQVSCFSVRFQADPISWWDTGGPKPVVILVISLDPCWTLVCPVESPISFSGLRSARLSRCVPRAHCFPQAPNNESLCWATCRTSTRKVHNVNMSKPELTFHQISTLFSSFKNTEIPGISLAPCRWFIYSVYRFWET